MNLQFNKSWKKIIKNLGDDYCNQRKEIIQKLFSILEMGNYKYASAYAKENNALSERYCLLEELKNVRFDAIAAYVQCVLDSKISASFTETLRIRELLENRFSMLKNMSDKENIFAVREMCLNYRENTLAIEIPKIPLNEMHDITDQHWVDFNQEMADFYEKKLERLNRELKCSSLMHA